MKKEILSGLAVFLLSAAAFCQNEIPSGKDTVLRLNDTEFKVSGVQNTKGSEILKDGILKESVILKTSNGELKLKQDKPVAYTFQNNQIASAYLDADTKIKSSGKELTLRGSSKIGFATTYKGEIFILSACLAENAIVTSGSYDLCAKALKSETEYDIFFNKNGEVTALILEKEQKFKIGDKEYSFALNTIITVDKGSVRNGTLAKTVVVDVNGLYKIPVKGEKAFASTIEFDYSGKISMVYVSEFCTIKVGTQNISLKPDNYVSFDKSTGKIKFAYLGVNSQLKVNGKMQSVSAGKQLEFDDKGNIIVAK
ncbi:MAG: hypothetical protein HY958_03875 [Bacteroidia bacterium]|nr:hypothetical protein [Bacteroidia bacterium]